MFQIPQTVSELLMPGAIILPVLVEVESLAAVPTCTRCESLCFCSPSAVTEGCPRPTL